MKSKFWLLSITLSSLAGLLVAASMMYIAWQHNPQGVVHDAVGIHWQFWSMIGVSWFVLVFLLIFLPLLIVRLVLKRRTSKMEENTSR